MLFPYSKLVLFPQNLFVLLLSNILCFICYSTRNTFMYILFYIIAFFFLILFIYLFIFGCVGSLFLCEGFLQLQQAGVTLHRGAQASHCRGLSCCGAQAPDTQAQ